MANSDAAFGLLPKCDNGSAPYNGGVNLYYVPASDTTALFVGDPVTRANGGDANGIGAVTRTTGTNQVDGVVVGFVPKPGAAAGSKSAVDNGYRAASTEDYVLVMDNADDIEFEVQEDSVGGALTAADIGKKVNFIYGAGNTASKLSGVEIDSSTKGSGVQALLVGLIQREDNELGNNAKWLVRLLPVTPA